MEKKKKISSILWGVAYFLVGCCILVSSCILFHNNYYSFIWVDGYSMLPTLNLNNKTEFGIVDNHKNVMNNIKRFDIVTTYYPIAYNSSNGLISDYSYIDEEGKEVYTACYDESHDVRVSSTADYKIKRVVALPGETFKVNQSGVDILNSEGKWDTYKFNYEHRSGDKTNTEPITLADDEYWVIGDNWGNSIDCKTISSPIKKENLQGVLIAIEGTCTVKRDKNGEKVIADKKYYSKFRVFKR